MNIIISDGSDKFVSVVDCPKEICKDFYKYLEDFVDSDMYRHNWGTEELIRYINKSKPSNLEDLKIIDLYTDKYDKNLPKFSI